MEVTGWCWVNVYTPETFATAANGLRQRDTEITAALTTAAKRSPLDVLLGAEDIEQMWRNDLTLGQRRAILAAVLTVTVLPGGKGGRAPDGSYFNTDTIDLQLTEQAHARLGAPTRR